MRYLPPWWASLAVLAGALVLIRRQERELGAAGAPAPARAAGGLPADAEERAHAGYVERAVPIPSRADTLGHPGPECVQHRSCKFFADILVVCHINPQRIEWIDPVLDYVGLFVPNVVFFSVVPTPRLQGLAPDQRHNLLHTEWAGRRPTRVHLIDSKLQIYGDHHDVAMAMRRWPGFTGYLAWEHEDSLVAWWNLAARGAFDKAAPWHQPVERLLIVGNSRECPSSVRRNLPRSFKPQPQKKYKSGGTLCVFGSNVEQTQNWQKAVPVVERIRQRNATDAARLRPGLTQGAGVYYVPAWARVKLLRYSRYLWDAGVYNEFAVPLLLTAACDGKQPSLLRGLNIWPDPPGRYHPVVEFRWQFDFTHPVRAVGELWARLTERARDEQIPSDRGDGSTAGLLRKGHDPLWLECFTCDEYPVDGPWGFERKGRFHTCTRNCTLPRSAVPPGSRNGLVQIRRRAVHYPGELRHEGFWGRDTEREIWAHLAGLWGAFDKDGRAQFRG